MPKNTTEKKWEQEFDAKFSLETDEGYETALLVVAKANKRGSKTYENLEPIKAFIQQIAKEEYERGRVDERGNYVMTFKTKEHLEGFIADIRAEERQRITSLIEGLVGGPSEEFGWTGDMYRGYNQALDDLLTHLRSFQESDETYNAEPRDSNETPEVGIQEETLGTAWELDIDESSGAAFLKETECCEKCIKHPKSDLVCKRFCPCHHKPRTELPKETNQAGEQGGECDMNCPWFPNSGNWGMGPEAWERARKRHEQHSKTNQ